MNKFKKIAVIILFVLLTSCANTGVDNLSEDGLKTISKNEFYAPKFPVDQHYIGYSWSKTRKKAFKNFSDDIEVEVQKSFSGMHDDIANKVLLSAAVTPVGIPVTGSATTGFDTRKYLKASGIQIIKPMMGDFARIPFKVGVPYITEALRVEGFEIAQKGGSHFGIAADANTAMGGAGGELSTSGLEDKGITGKGLVIGYKFEMLDEDSLETKNKGPEKLNLDKKVVLSSVDITAKLEKVTPNNPLSKNLIWACASDRALRSKYLAAWVIYIKFNRHGERTLMPVAFPALNTTDDLLCNSFSAILSTQFSVQKDKYTRKKIKITINKANVNYNIRPINWDVDVAIIDQAFSTQVIDVE